MKESLKRKEEKKEVMMTKLAMFLAMTGIVRVIREFNTLFSFYLLPG